MAAYRRRVLLRHAERLSVAAEGRFQAIKDAKRIQRIYQILGPKTDRFVERLRWERSQRDARDYRDRYRGDPEFALHERMRRAMRKHRNIAANLGSWMRLRWAARGRSRKLEALCGYTLGQLREHLEALFMPGMTWQRFMDGAIHIDHIIPMRAFDMTDPQQFRRCWSFENLQPLWAADNIRKADRMPDGLSARAMVVRGPVQRTFPSATLRRASFV